MAVRLGGSLARATAVAIAWLLVAAVGSSGAAWTGPTDSPRSTAWLPVLRPDCDVSGNVIATADQLLNNRYTIGQQRTVRLPADPTWREDPFHDDNWLFNYHSLRFVLTLEAAWARTGDGRYLDRGLFLLRDWLHDNPRRAPRSPFSWNDHATALRAMVLACTAEIVPMSTWLHSGLLLHGWVLADPHFYVWHGNHALNQAIALLDIGCFLGRPGWTALASARIETLVTESIDSQGVSNEQAISYDLYDYERFQIAEDRLLDCGRRVSAEFARVDRMPDFLGWATLPNGEYELIGDTRAVHAADIPGTLAEYAATGGSSGPKPTRMFATFAAGYAFGRSGWGETRPFADETAFTVRYGRGRAYHGHPDGGSLTVYGYGSRLIVGTGTYSYNPGPYRAYFIGRSAQNVVTVGGVPYRASVTTRLLFRRETLDALGLGVQVRGYPGVRDIRSVVFSRRGGYLLVDDRLSAAGSRTFSQLWHLGPGSRPTVVARTVRTHGPGGEVAIIQLADRPSISIVTGRTHPIQGWRTFQYNQRVASPTVVSRRTGRVARFLTLIVPVPDATTPVHAGSVRRWANGYSVVVTAGTVTERVVVDGSSITITPLT